MPAVRSASAIVASVTRGVAGMNTSRCRTLRSTPCPCLDSTQAPARSSTFTKSSALVGGSPVGGTWLASGTFLRGGVVEPRSGVTIHVAKGGEGRVNMSVVDGLIHAACLIHCTHGVLSSVLLRDLPCDTPSSASLYGGSSPPLYPAAKTLDELRNRFLRSP